MPLLIHFAGAFSPTLIRIKNSNQSIIAAFISSNVHAFHLNITTTGKRYVGLALLFLGLVTSKIYAQDLLTNQSIIQMSETKVSSSIIISKVRASKNAFDLTTNGLLQFATAKVQSSVIEAMLQGVSLTDVMTNEDVIRLWNADLPRKLIIQKINSSKSDYDITTNGLIQLKNGKVPDQIVKVMMVAPNVTKRQPLPSPVQQTSTPNASKNVRCTKWIDQFTKKTVTVSEVILRGKKAGNLLLGRNASPLIGLENMEISLLFRRDNQETVLVMHASKPGFNNLVVTRDKPLLLLMNDKSVLTFTPIMDSEFGVDFNYNGYTVDSKLSVYYAINQDQLKYLSSKIVKAYRLHTYNKSYYEDTVNLSRASQVQEAAICLLN